MQGGLGAARIEALGRAVLCPLGKAGLGMMGNRGGGDEWREAGGVAAGTGTSALEGLRRSPSQLSSSVGWEGQSLLWESLVEAERD